MLAVAEPRFIWDTLEFIEDTVEAELGLLAMPDENGMFKFAGLKLLGFVLVLIEIEGRSFPGFSFVATEGLFAPTEQIGDGLSLYMVDILGKYQWSVIKIYVISQNGISIFGEESGLNDVNTRQDTGEISSDTY